MVQLVNPFSLLAEKHVNDLVGAVEAKAESSFLAAKKKEQDEKKKKEKQKQKQKPPPRPVSSAAKPKSTIPISTGTGGSLKSYNGGQHQQRGPADSVSVSSSNSTNDFDQTQGSESEEAKKNTKEADPDAEGWQLVQYQTRKKGPWSSGNHGQTQGAVGKNHVNVEEGIRQLQEVVKGLNGSQGVKPRRPNINGSARRKLQKQKAGVGQDQQFQVKNNAAAAAENVPAQNKSTVSYTLEEFEMMKKKNGGLNIHNELFKAHEDPSYRGRQQQRGGHRSNDKIEDVSQEATVEKADDTLFSLNPGEFPVLGKLES